MRMRYCQILGMDVTIVVEKNVNVDDTVMILSTHRLLGASHITFYLLGDPQQGTGREFCHDTHCCIKEGILTLKSPRLSGKKSGLCPNRTNPPLYFFDGGQEVLLFVAKVGAE